MKRFFVVVSAVAVLCATSRPCDAVYLIREQDYTAEAAGYWQALFYEYTFSTLTTSEVQVGRATVPAQWLLYGNWFGLFLYDYTTGRFEEALYYRNDRL